MRPEECGLLERETFLAFSYNLFIIYDQDDFFLNIIMERIRDYYSRNSCLEMIRIQINVVVKNNILMKCSVIFF